MNSEIHHYGIFTKKSEFFKTVAKLKSHSSEGGLSGFSGGLSELSDFTSAVSVSESFCVSFCVSSSFVSVLVPSPELSFSLSACSLGFSLSSFTFKLSSSFASFSLSASLVVVPTFSLHLSKTSLNFFASKS